MEQTSDPRLRQIMVSLVKHLHGFVRDVRLTEKEFRELFDSAGLRLTKVIPTPSPVLVIEAMAK